MTIKASRVLFALLFVSFPAAAADLVLTLAVESRSALPAIPPSLRITARNAGASAAAFPARAALLVIPPEGEPFLALGEHLPDERGVPFLSDVEGDSFPLQPGESRDVSLWQSLSSPRWFAGDTRLWSPGTYRLRLIAGTRNQMLQIASAPAPSFEGLVTSNEAVYTVKQPTGDDAVAWDLIRSLESPAGWADQLRGVISARAPSSVYAAYSFPIPADPEGRIRTYEAAIQRLAGEPYADLLRHALATFHIDRMQDLITARQGAQAFEASQRACTILTELEKSARDPQVREEARQSLQRVMSRSEIDDYIARIQGTAAPLFAPTAPCGERLDYGRIKVWFSYTNDANEAVELPVGNANQFTPAPHDRGQPGRFDPGAPRFLFSVTTDEPELTWHLDKESLHVKTRELPECRAIGAVPPV